MHRDHRQPFVRRHPVEDHVAQDAGVVHHTVDPSIVVECRLDDLLCRVPFGDGFGADLGGAAFLFDQLLGPWAGVAEPPSPDSEAPMSATMTFAPAAAMASAISRPMPPPEPVTTTCRPSCPPCGPPCELAGRTLGGGGGLVNGDRSRQMVDGAWISAASTWTPISPGSATQGRVPASLALLRELVAHHSAAIAFENIDPLARRVPPLDLASVQRKLVTQRRGGYCYEQNTLFQGALLALGFQVTGLMARVRRGVPPHIMTPRSHMLLLVDLPEGPHLADVGYGALTPTAPLRLRADLEQATPNEVFRLGLIGDEFTPAGRDRRRLGGCLSVRAVAAATDRLRGDQLAHGDAAQRAVRGEPRRDPTDARCPPDAVQSPVQRARGRALSLNARCCGRGTIISASWQTNLG